MDIQNVNKEAYSSQAVDTLIKSAIDSDREQLIRRIEEMKQKEPEDPYDYGDIDELLDAGKVIGFNQAMDDIISIIKANELEK